MNLIKIDDGKYKEYENLLLDRDQVIKEADQIWIVYQQQFGTLLTDVFEAKIECIKRKKTIAYYQKMINQGKAVDQEAMKQWLDREMREYYDELTRMIREHKRAKDARTSTPYEAQRTKELYRRIAKMIHPDIRPETDQSGVLIDLWNRTVIAYQANNVKELAEVEVLVRRALKEQGIDISKAEIPDIDEKIESLKEEIEEIKSNKPYTYLPLIENEEECRREVEKLEEELEEYRTYQGELDNTIFQMIGKGGVAITWQMN